VGLLARLRQTPWATGTIPSVASATALPLPEGGNIFIVTGSTTIATIQAVKQPGRLVTLIADAGVSLTITNNSDPTTEGQIDLGGSNLTFAAQDALTLRQMNNGTWNKVAVVDL
jgi:hypothetical protein